MDICYWTVLRKEAGPRAYRWQEVAVLEGGCPGLKYCEHYIPLRSQINGDTTCMEWYWGFSAMAMWVCKQLSHELYIFYLFLCIC
uniref:Uncharacterized protein n=1 Tax=Oryza barthii TaxID=65489 RepID=A0A0D3EJ32_9ORYZ